MEHMRAFLPATIRPALVACFILTPTFFTGCLDFVQNFVFHEDGSGTMTLEYSARRQTAPLLAGQRFSFDRDHIATCFTGGGLAPDTVAVFTRDADTTIHALVTVRFQRFTQLDSLPALGGMRHGWTTREGHTFITQTFPPIPEAGGAGMRNNFVRVDYALPWSTASTESGRVRNGRYTWFTSLAGLEQNGAVVSIRSPYTPAAFSLWSSETSMWLKTRLALALVVGIISLCGTAIGAVLFHRRKRDATQTAD